MSSTYRGDSVGRGPGSSSEGDYGGSGGAGISRIVTKTNKWNVSENAKGETVLTNESGTKLTAPSKGAVLNPSSLKTAEKLAKIMDSTSTPEGKVNNIKITQGTQPNHHVTDMANHTKTVK